MKYFHDKPYCLFCRRSVNLQRHHIFEGSRRQLSEEMGLVVNLCMDHHVGKYAIHTHPKMDRTLKAQAQEWWEQQPGNSHELWMEKMRKNYL